MQVSFVRLAAPLQREVCRVVRNTCSRHRPREPKTLAVPSSSRSLSRTTAATPRLARHFSRSCSSGDPNRPQSPRPPPPPPSSSSSSPSPRPGQQQQSDLPPPRAPNSQIKFWPFALVIGLGFVGYAALVNRRKEMTPLPGSKSSAGHLGSPMKSTPAFSPADVVVVFVLGGPGAGKGTQCERLVREHGFAHLSAGDLLRAEQARPGSQFGELISECIRTGAIVPMEVTIQLLENAMTEVISGLKKDAAADADADAGSNSNKNKNKKAKFLIDGFPRKMDQALRFEEVVVPARFVLFYDCPEAELERRLLERGKTSGREDDNPDSIRKRFRTFVDVSMPVVDHYTAQGRVVRVDGTPGADQVFAETEKLLAKRINKDA